MMSIEELIKEVSEMHPYKVGGDRDSYSKYNEGWSDACDILGEKWIEHAKQLEKERDELKSANKRIAKEYKNVQKQRDDAFKDHQEFEELHAQLQTEKKRVEELEERLKRFDDLLTDLNLEIGSKCHDNEINIKNGRNFCLEWKRKHLDLKQLKLK